MGSTVPCGGVGAFRADHHDATQVPEAAGGLATEMTRPPVWWNGFPDYLVVSIAGAATATRRPPGSKAHTDGFSSHGLPR